MAKRLIIQGAEVVTMDAALGDFPAADILVEDGAIVAVGPSLDAAGAERIDGAGMIALPGIIDAHTCLWQTVLRGYVPDLWHGTYNTALLPLRRWILCRNSSFLPRRVRRSGHRSCDGPQGE